MFSADENFLVVYDIYTTTNWNAGVKVEPIVEDYLSIQVTDNNSLRLTDMNLDASKSTSSKQRLVCTNEMITDTILDFATIAMNQPFAIEKELTYRDALRATHIGDESQADGRRFVQEEGDGRIH